MTTRVRIPLVRKCYGTFDLDYYYGQGDIPVHSTRTFYPKLGILSFKHNSTEIEIEFTEEQWKNFMKDMLQVDWNVAKMHSGQC